MSEIQARIEQFRKMADADPENELGHFSLGKAYLDAGETQPAIAALTRAIELNPNIAKVYQLLGSALLKEGKRDEAVAKLTAGVKIAADRGDMMPRNEMSKMLTELGAPVPEAASAPQQSAGEGEVHCQRCGKIGKRMSEPPFSNAQGKEIQEKICAPCWREWIGMGTKVINELRLPLSDPQAQKVFERHMREFLNL